MGERTASCGRAVGFGAAMTELLNEKHYRVVCRFNKAWHWASGWLAVLTISSTTWNARSAPSELPPEVGFDYGQVQTPGLLALGGAQHALGSSLTALYVNPANLAQTRVYHVGAHAQFSPEAKRQSYGGAAGGFNHEPFAVGGWFWRDMESPGCGWRWIGEYTDLRMALAMPLSDRFLVGLGGRYLRLTQAGFGIFGPSLASGGLAGEAIVNDLSFDAGATIKPHDDWSLSVVGTNLTAPGNGFQPITLGGRRRVPTQYLHDRG